MCLIQIRCYSCGKITGNKWEPYKKMLSEGISSNDALDKLKLKRYCCRRIILTYVNLINEILEYST